MKIGRKQTSKQSDFIKVYRNIEKIISFDDIKRIEEKAVNHLIRSTYKKKVEFGWSGGKDSLVLQKLCEKAGIKKGFFLTTNLEYTSFNEYVNTFKPSYIDEYNLGYDISFLVQNPQYLFPKQSSKLRWLNIIQGKNVEKYYWDHELDQLVLGRRTIDGNYCPNRMNTTAKGYTTNLPIYDWSQEDIIGYLHYYNIPLPDIYFYRHGFQVGTGPWCKVLRTKNRSLRDCWEYVYENEREIVEECAKHFVSAEQFLTERRTKHERNPAT